MTKREQIIDLLNKCIIGESVANTADKILALYDVIKNEVTVCDNEWHESNMQHFGECHACGEKVEC